ncbi:YhcB family protein [Pseudoalteromonas luteoviolacea]|uniref:Z-ring associated protein G n=1 Tax=Pseudoalteromonas luteoviolacea DSM 6061 TaxID=1365250 RepID=A0A166WFC5_9GAMM|nr:DUF1043 family protein [Pseudoalteromonas luteoviolacea]KZN37329.1 hypothetical protein N475_16675 [Pseudoalteromonas luteoviolacea DSM 6061]KZN59419.1 hypothetical protein N474_06925 [Pseudoalteromonas luteoviolacea CPMOR-2]MBE0387444.1 hypothetical protein [Pseudoalteromonas luteoviolacea DSM 6061]TQF72253.1 DUF1043 family protein [Pseudoalteromonas luteoviolacea]
MTTIAWLGLLIIVAICAFFLGSQFTKKQFKHEEIEQQAKQAEQNLEQYRQDVADHLANTKKLVGKMQDNYSQLLQHVEETNQLLIEEKRKAPSEPFFSKETTEQLQASLRARPEKRRSEEYAQNNPPMDYAEGESGLFTGDRSKTEQINTP